MCSVTKQYKTMKGDYLAEDNIFNQLVHGEYESWSIETARYRLCLATVTSGKTVLCPARIT